MDLLCHEELMFAKYTVEKNSLIGSMNKLNYDLHLQKSKKGLINPIPAIKSSADKYCI